ncbi:MAG: DUF1836 domain-containing protein [Lachnospiraceae bacterium]|nr:DUF1836 domain-containing protein [Lachnospiraceae bacterium]
MSKESKDWLETAARLSYIKPEDIPEIDLYMDQVTTFMEAQLSATKRTPDDKIMTKTMINNYTKNKLLPPPLKKKYTKDHMYMLIFIYYFKNIMSIADIQKLIRPLTENFFGKKDKEEMPEQSCDLDKIYETVFHMEHDYYYKMKENIESSKEQAEHTFEEIEGEDGEFLRKFSYISLLCYDIYIRKQMIETMVDEMFGQEEENKKKK